MNNHTFLPINISDNHNKSTHGLLHHIILNKLDLSDKYKSLTIINNTINYNTNDNYLFKEDNKKANNNFNNDIDSDFSEINKSISPSQKKKQIDNLKNNLKSEFKEAINIQNEKSISSYERNKEYKNNNDIIISENIIVNMEEISSSNKINDENDSKKNDDSYIYEDEITQTEKSKNINAKSTENNIDTTDNIKINSYDKFKKKLKSPNKGVNLVKKGLKKFYKNNLKSALNNQEDIFKLYKLNGSLSNDIVFFFVDKNTSKGNKLLNLEYKSFLQYINGKQILIYIFDMNNETENNKMDEGIKILLTELDLHKIIKIVLACGDESIFPFIEKLNSYSINFEKIIFSVLPFGKSNDLSIQFGFGKYTSFTNFNLVSIKNIIKEIIESTSVSIDIWEIKLTFDGNNGGYKILNNKLEKIKIKKSTFYKGFISYFSLGYDSRIGFNVSKKKCNESSICNCLNFWWEAIKKNFCTKSIKLNQYLDSLCYINLNKNNNLYENEKQTIKEDNAQKITIFQTNDIDLNIHDIHDNDNISVNNSQSENRIVPTNESINKKKKYKNNNINNITNENEEENEIESDSDTESEEVNSTVKPFKYEKIIIKGDPLGLICQNIKYFCDGNLSKWNTKKPKYGIQIRNKKMSVTSINKSSNKDLKKVR
jgi:hypothetical protein